VEPPSEQNAESDNLSGVEVVDPTAEKPLEAYADADEVEEIEVDLDEKLTSVS
jgi:hypothetical protein